MACEIVDRNSAVRDLVARGEVKVGLTDTDDVNVAIEAGQPVAMVLPDRDGIGVPVMPNMVSLIANAPHLDEGQEADRLSAVSGRRAPARSIRGRANPAARRGAGTQEHSGRSTASSR